MALNLLSDTAEKLEQAARSENKDVDVLISEMLAMRQASTETAEYRLPREVWLQRFQEWLDSFDGQRRPLTNECLTREYIYFDTKF